MSALRVYRIDSQHVVDAAFGTEERAARKRGDQAVSGSDTDERPGRDSWRSLLNGIRTRLRLNPDRTFFEAFPYGFATLPGDVNRDAIPPEGLGNYGGGA